ncbi:THAP domain-containing protein 1-like isoform X2 [Monomorium pharaonis]|uniref:THAP domain-containing protein 1 isoform X2 n=1 Tax=Monomorium pharaonis TaxID=307658 RepID=UPI00063F15C5|nr:THAP domain-containing protein 1 isoform X2 [Monomorium pharaonis]XP_036141461.1 THAP domain-containing protein 1-like isoform X2 [Monomorium pharaonis]
MSFCVVYNCKNRKHKNKKNIEQLEMERVLNRNISFHLFPQDMAMRKKWLEAIHLQNYEPKKSATVCSVHFKETDYQFNHKYCKLKKDAVPHLLKTEIQPKYTNVDKPRVQTNLDKPLIQKNLHEPPIEKTSNVPPLQIDSDNPPPQTYSNYPLLQTVSSNLDHQNISIEENKADNTNKMVHRSTSISPDRIMNSPVKTRIRKVYKNEIKHLKRKLSISRYKQKRTQKKLCALKNILKELQKQNLLAAEDNDILQHLKAES